MGDDSVYENQMFEYAIYGGSKEERQKNAVEMFDKTADVGTYIKGAGVILKSPQLVGIGESIDIGATTMKYLVDPNQHKPYEIYNDYVPFPFKVTPLE